MIFNFFKRNRDAIPASISDFDNLRSTLQLDKGVMLPVNMLEKKHGKPTVDVTVMINVWKRTHLEEQLFHLLSQTVFPTEIWILHYEKHVEIENIVAAYKEVFPFIQVLRSDKNLKYFGRFTIAVNVPTTYTWIIDDDVVPGMNWLGNAVVKCEKYNSIISCTGRIIPKNNFRPEKSWLGGHFKYFVGDQQPGEMANFCEQDTEVDYACNSYFFKSEWIRAFWSVWPLNFLSGEDIHLSASCKIKLGVRTMVMEQVSGDDSGNIKRPYGWDDNASWKQSNFIDVREDILRYHIKENKWTPLLWGDQ
jgi:hypothetical protein